MSATTHGTRLHDDPVRRYDNRKEDERMDSQDGPEIEQMRTDYGTVYYSTPFGDTKDGQQKLFILGRDGIPFYPVFFSRESTMAFFQRMNRAGYPIIEGTVQSVLDTLRTIEPLKNAGIVIEPFSEHPIEIPPGV